MNFITIGYGNAGSRLAEMVLRFSKKRRYPSSVSDAIAVNTTRALLDKLSWIDDDNRIVVTPENMHVSGTGWDLEEAKSMIRKNSAALTSVISDRINASNEPIDAILLLGSLAGGTGGAGLTYGARDIGDAFPNIPIYTGAVLSHLDEPAVGTYNAAQSIQPVNEYSDTVFLFDNHNHDIYHPVFDDEIDAKAGKHFHEVNESFARNLFLTLSADDVSKDENDDSYANANTIKGALSAGNFAAFNYTSTPIPRPAQQGVIGYLSKSINTVLNREMPDPESDIPHPVDLLSETMDPNRPSIACEPYNAKHALHLLIAPDNYLSTEDTEITNRWVGENTSVQEHIAVKYPFNGGSVAALGIYVDIGLPERLKDIQTIAKRFEQATEENTQQHRSRKNNNILDATETIDTTLET